MEHRKGRSEHAAEIAAQLTSTMLAAYRSSGGTPVFVTHDDNGVERVDQAFVEQVARAALAAALIITDGVVADAHRRREASTATDRAPFSGGRVRSDF